mmetsp:Transcript_71/g.120  ORF Transcript_71/g.120 Transcript_71/m.120 type:complete len:558 (+) Transcript_71:28-1701(+)
MKSLRRRVSSFTFSDGEQKQVLCNGMLTKFNENDKEQCCFFELHATGVIKWGKEEGSCDQQAKLVRLATEDPADISDRNFPSGLKDRFFSLETTDKPLHLSTANREQKRAWVDAIQELLDGFDDESGGRGRGRGGGGNSSSSSSSSDDSTSSADTAGAAAHSVSIIKQKLVKMTKDGKSHHSKVFELFSSGMIMWGSSAGNYKHSARILDVSQKRVDKLSLKAEEEERFFCIFTTFKTLLLIAPTIRDRDSWLTAVVSVTSTVKRRAQQEQRELAAIRAELAALRHTTAQQQQHIHTMKTAFEAQTRESSAREVELVQLIAHTLNSVPPRAAVQTAGAAEVFPATPRVVAASMSLNTAVKLLAGKCEELATDHTLITVQQQQRQAKDSQIVKLCAEMRATESCLRADKDDLCRFVQKLLRVKDKANAQLQAKIAAEAEQTRAESSQQHEQNIQVMEQTLLDQEKEFRKKEEGWAATVQDLQAKLKEMAAGSQRRSSMDFLTSTAEDTMKDAQIEMQKEALSGLRDQLAGYQEQVSRLNRQAKVLQDKAKACTCGKAR